MASLSPSSLRFLRRELEDFVCRSWYPLPMLLGEMDGVSLVAAWRAGDEYTLVVPCPLCKPRRRPGPTPRFVAHFHAEPLYGSTFYRTAHCDVVGKPEYRLAILGDFPWQKPVEVKP